MKYILMFIIGTIFGSFYNVVGYRIPKDESIVYPPSHCPKCNHKLKYFELIPILSYIIQKGKCTNCKKNIGLFYPAFELLTGIIFAISLKIYGLTPNLIIIITFISMLIIITISDINYMIIPDKVLIFFAALLLIEIFFIKGLNEAFYSIINGIISFTIMYIIKLIGDFIFKKESMGGGDIKLMFLIGMILTYKNSLLTIFIGSLIGLPISLITIKKNKNHILPFGPLLAAGAIIIALTQININTLIEIMQLRII
ncbi:MAG: prepilin peptidase [Bacilli bacterium]|nr:prepilin peptidase [Bacilli bacterium]